MKRRNIRKITTEPNTYGDQSKNFPRITLRPGGVPQVQPNPGSRNFTRNKKPLKERNAEPITFLQGSITKAIKDIDPEATVLTDPPTRKVTVKTSLSVEKVSYALIEAGFPPRD